MTLTLRTFRVDQQTIHGPVHHATVKAVDAAAAVRDACALRRRPTLRDSHYGPAYRTSRGWFTATEVTP